MRAARYAGGAAIASGCAVLLASAGHAGPAAVLAAFAIALELLSRRALRLAGRSRVGAESEARVRRALDPLALEGWRVAHGVDWPGRGDLDHVLRSPSGMGFVIETKTLRYRRTHVRRTIEAARRLARERRRYPRGVLPVMCVTGARRVEAMQEGAFVVSLDRLVEAVSRAAEGPAGGAPARAFAPASWMRRGREEPANRSAKPAR